MLNNRHVFLCSGLAFAWATVLSGCRTNAGLGTDRPADAANQRDSGLGDAPQNDAPTAMGGDAPTVSTNPDVGPSSTGDTAPPASDAGRDLALKADAPVGADGRQADVAVLADAPSDLPSSVCTPGRSPTCNDDPVSAMVAGDCQADGTCVCRSGFVVNPSTGRCQRASVPDAAVERAPVCTQGMDQTCNDDSLISTTWGRCQDGVCICNTGYVVNPATGRCSVPSATCSGTYEACGCGCCSTVQTRPVCYYPTAGDSLAQIIADDRAVAASPTCANAGCSLPQQYICCEDAQAEPAGTAQYSAVSYIGGINRIRITKQAADGTCSTVSFMNGSTGSSGFRINSSEGWVIDNAMLGGSCADGGSSAKQAMGGLGTMTFSRDGSSCAVTVHLTLFFTDSVAGPATKLRLDADDLPVAGDIPSTYCQP